MTAHLWNHKLSYVAIPKVACTSVKLMFFEIENGRPFEPFKINGQAKHIHHFYPGLDFDKQPHAKMAGNTRLTLVRDPLQRLLSCYSNRVVHHKELSEANVGGNLKKAGLKPDPDLSLFLQHFDAYRAAAQSIYHHSRPMTDFIGTDPGYYDTVFSLSQIGDFVQRVEQIIGHPVRLRHAQTGGPKISRDVLTPAQVDFIHEFYAQVYAIWGKYT